VGTLSGAATFVRKVLKSCSNFWPLSETCWKIVRIFYLCPKSVEKLF
jgi:hypothetical protein